MATRFKISEDEYAGALKLHAKLTPGMMAIYLLVACILVLIAIFGSALIRSMAIGGLIGGGIAVILGRLVINPMLARRHYRKYKAIQDEFGISLDAEGLFVESSNAKGLLPWNNILKWRENDEFLLLYLMPRLYHIVPKTISRHGFDIDSLIDSLIKNVGKSV